MVLNQHCGLLYEQNEQEGEQTIRVTASLRIMCHVQRHDNQNYRIANNGDIETV